MPEKHLRNVRRVLLGGAVILACATCAGAQTFKVLYSFTGGTDGGGVWSGVVMDKQGNLYGTTSGGGAYGYGTVFELSPNSDGTWAETVLHSFKNGDPDGQEPDANLIFDAAGNLYGTTPTGGKHNVGSVFELTPSASGWSLTLIYSFGGYRGDAGPPRGALVMDRKAIYTARQEVDRRERARYLNFPFPVELGPKACFTALAVRATRRWATSPGAT
ncbi:MAG TPA: choice-of-anchor tandem repeat GloVer-containing protein [Candidatus Sulfotelmatobacter sp.]